MTSKNDSSEIHDVYCSNTNIVSYSDDDNNLSIAGFPLPIATTDTSKRNGKYKKCWEPPERPKPVNQPPVPNSVLVSWILMAPNFASIAI